MVNLKMAWRDVLTLLELADGDESSIAEGRMQFATSTGSGEPQMQLRIARVMFRVKYGKKTRRKESKDNGQEEWNFA